MGKQKKERKHAPSARPTTDPTGAALAAALSAASPSAATEHAEAQSQLLAKLDPASSDVQKAVACSGVAHILANQLRPAASLVTPQLLRRLMPLLLERRSYDVAISAAGAARNISAVGAHAHGAQAQAQANAVLTLLLNSDACTVLISMLEAEKTAWMLSLPEGAPLPAAAASSSSSSSDSPSTLQPTTPGDKRAHFLAQVVSALANLSEQFDAVLAYFTNNVQALSHCITLLLDENALGAVPSFWGVALQVEISNLLLLVSESNAEFARCLARLPAGFGGVAGVASKLLQRVEAQGPGVSPQVRVHCAGILLNMQSPAVLMSLSSAASAQLQLPGATPQAGAPPVGPEQLCITGVLRALSSVLDLDPLALGGELVASLRVDRAAVDARLAALDSNRKLEDVQYKQAAEARHAAKKAAKAALAAGAPVEVTEDDSMATGDESKAGDAAASSSSSATAAPVVVPASNAIVTEPHDDNDGEIMYADASDEMESTHKDAAAAQGSAAASSSKKSPEVLIAAQWSAHLEQKLQHYRHFLLSARIALELLTNLASSPDDENDEEGSGTSDSDNDAGLLDPNHLGYIPKLILHLGLLPKIVHKCQLRLAPLPGAAAAPASASASSSASGSSSSSNETLHAALLSIYPAEDVSVRLVELVDEVRTRALSCLNNLVLFLPREVLLQQNMLPGVWQAGCELVASILPAYNNPAGEGAAAAVAEMAALTSLLFQVARKDTAMLDINKAVVTMLLQLARSPSDSPAAAASSSSSSSLSAAAAAVGAAAALAPAKRGVQLNMIGLLALLGSKHPAALPFHFVIASTLLDSVKQAGTLVASAQAANNPAALHVRAAADEAHFLEVASEALNGLIDLYSEDNTHVQAQQSLGLVAVLEQFLPLFHAAIKVLQQQRQPKVDRELISRLQENALNTKEFVKYKKLHP